MKYEVFLTVRGEQEYDGGETDRIELTADGTLEDTADGWMISYDQTERSEQTHTVLLVGARCVVLRRGGALQAEMTFETGKTHITVYEMPFGTLLMEISTETIRQKLSERGGLLEIRYRIAMDGRMQSKNSLKIQIRRKG